MHQRSAVYIDGTPKPGRTLFDYAPRDLYMRCPYNLHETQRSYFSTWTKDNKEYEFETCSADSFRVTLKSAPAMHHH